MAISQSTLYLVFVFVVPFVSVEEAPEPWVIQVFLASGYNQTTHMRQSDVAKMGISRRPQRRLIWP